MIERGSCYENGCDSAEFLLFSVSFVAPVALFFVLFLQRRSTMGGEGEGGEGVPPTKSHYKSSFKAATVVQTRLFPVNIAHSYCPTAFLPEYKPTASISGHRTHPRVLVYAGSNTPVPPTVASLASTVSRVYVELRRHFAT